MRRIGTKALICRILWTGFTDRMRRKPDSELSAGVCGNRTGEAAGRGLKEPDGESRWQEFEGIGRRKIYKMNMEERIARINELYHKSKAEGLTEEERREQARLRSEYIANIRAGLRSQLNNISVEQEDGSVVNLGEKYGHVGTH